MRTNNIKSVLASLVALLVSVSVNAYDAEIDGIYYNLVSKAKQATVTYQGEHFSSNDIKYSGDVIIPSTVIYNGVTYNVTSIGDYAFYDCSNLISVTIPSSVTIINNTAFQNCTSLTSMTIPSSVTSIGTNAFCSCTSLTSVTIPSGVTSIGSGAFQNCTSLTSIELPSSVTSIEAYMFRDCTGLTSVTIPSSVTSIGYNAFEDCSSLTSIELPSSVTIIPFQAFIRCTSLTSVTIPSSVTYIEGGVFAGCTSLTSVTIEGSPDIFDSVFDGCSNLIIVTLNGGNIRTKVFANCPELMDVYCNSEFPPSVEATDVFENSYIDYVTLHVPAEYIDNYANDSFWGSSFKEIVTIEPIEHPTSIALTDGETFEGYSVNVDMEEIIYSRTYKSTNWQAWYVPFDLTLTDDVLEDFSFAKFAGTYTEDDGTFYISITRMGEGDVVKANTPYLVQAKMADSENPQVITLTDATLYAAQEKGFSMYSAEKKVTVQGIYSRKEVTEEDRGWYALSGGKYSQQNKLGNALNPFRFYLTITDREDNPYASTSNPTEVKIKVLGEDETGVAPLSVSLEGERTAVYDLSGRRVEKDKVTKGISIINGKKVFVR